MRDMRSHAGRLGLILVLGLSGGCGSDNNPESAAAKPATPVILDGSSTVFRISKAAQEDFSAVDSNVTIVVNNHGTGGGFARYAEGEVDIVDASRAATADEESKAKAQGIDWTRFIVGYDGVTLVVNPKNDFVKSLTVDQLKIIWAPGSKVKTWKDIDAAWPDRKIIFYSPDNDSGTFDFFTEAVVGKTKSQRDDAHQSSDDNTLVSGVAGDADGLGYFGYAYFADNKDKLRAVAIQNGPGAQPVLPSPAAIADKSYTPLARPLFIYVKNSAVSRAEVAKFLTFYLDNVEKLATKVNYNPITAEDRAANQAAFAKMLGRGQPESKEAPKPAA